MEKFENGSLKVPISWQYMKPPQFESYWFEYFDVDWCRTWMENNWTWSIYICAGYLTLIYIGKRIMETREPFHLRKQLALWNMGFAIFSIVGLCRCLPELLYVLNQPNGFFRSVCVRADHNQPAAFWAWVFTLSKVIELGDTFFIILRKKPLHFIHYYHHGIAVIVCFRFYPDYEPIFRWFGIGNYLVHAVLYSYLFLKSISINLPRLASKALISIELLQFLMGVTLNVYSIWVIYGKGEICDRTKSGIAGQMAVYMSFVVLFIYIFKTEMSGSNTHAKKKEI